MLHIAELGICVINYSGDYDFKGAKRELTLLMVNPKGFCM